MSLDKYCIYELVISKSIFLIQIFNLLDEILEFLLCSLGVGILNNGPLLFDFPVQLSHHQQGVYHLANVDEDIGISDQIHLYQLVVLSDDVVDGHQTAILYVFVNAHIHHHAGRQR